MAASGPPKCRTCGVTEWRHLCGGLPKVGALEDFVRRGVRAQEAVDAVIGAKAPAFQGQNKPPADRPKAVAMEKVGKLSPVEAGGNSKKTGPTTIAHSKPDFDKNVYQREYMRDYRAAKKAGLSVEDYRKTLK